MPRSDISSPAVKPAVAQRLRRSGPDRNKGGRMLWTIIGVLLVLWLIGTVTAHTAGGLIHVLLLIAVAVVLVRIIQGRRPVT
jgi:hypothetical protein